MEKIKEFWNNKSQADKRKVIVYAIAGVVCVALVAIVILINTKNTTEEVADFSNPDAKEVAKYNSRTEANDLGKKDSANLDLALNNMFGESEAPATIENPSTYSEPDYGSNSGGYAQPSYSEQPAPKSTGGGYNSHSTYGDYSMWQDEEPQNNSVGYTNKKNVPTTGKKDKSPEYTEIETPVYQEPSYQNSSSLNGTANISNGQQVSAQLISQGVFQNGRTLSFALKEETNIKGNKLPKNFVLQGIGEIQNNRIMVKFNTIKVGNKLVPVAISLLDNNGMEGMGISRAEKSSEGENRVLNEAVGRTGTVGGIISSVITPRTTERKINLKPKQVYLIIN